MSNIDNIHTDFLNRGNELKVTFIDSIPASASLLPTHQEKEFCKAFTVLFHACLEDYFEKLSIELISLFQMKFRNSSFVEASDLNDLALLNKKIKRQIETYLMIISFAVHKGSKGKMTEDFEENTKKLNQASNNSIYRHDNPVTEDTLKSIKTTTEYVDKLLVEANNILLQKFGEENHGVALPNIVEMLTAVGIDVNKNINLQNSLRHFVYYRGDYAHRGIYSKISRIFNKTDILSYYEDCLLLCKDVYDNAKIKL